MSLIQKLGILSLPALISCSPEDRIVKRNQDVQIKNHCVIENYAMGNSINGDHTLSTHAIDTNGDVHFDEAFVIREHTNLSLFDYENSNEIAIETTHYVVPGLAREQQLLTGFPDTAPMFSEYEQALQLVCSGERIKKFSGKK